jgi:PLP dependent protein
MSLIAANLQGVLSQIDAAMTVRRTHFCDPVTLIAVSKTKPISDIQTAFNAGQRHFGENYVQEAAAKIIALTSLQNTSDNPIVWHLIGPLQSNKAKIAAMHFDWVHSVDRIKIADALHQHRDQEAPPLNVLVQVNVSGETSKSGVAPAEARALIDHVAALPRLSCRGLMAIVENVADEATLRTQFQQMRSLFDVAKTSHPHFDTLSMGMSQDFAVAIDEGATMVRVGSAIFGARDLVPAMPHQ